MKHWVMTVGGAIWLVFAPMGRATDTDLDGFEDGEEEALGTDPADAGIHPTLADESTKILRWWPLQSDGSEGWSQAESGVLRNGPLWRDGALWLDGRDDHVRFDSTLSITGAVSWSVWLRPGKAKGVQRILGKFASKGNRREHAAFFMNDGRLSVFLSSDGSNRRKRSVLHVSRERVRRSGEWMHLAMTWEADAGPEGLRVYTNGAAAALVSVSAGEVHSLYAGSAALTLGTYDVVAVGKRGKERDKVANAFPGGVSSFLLSDAVLSALEVQELFRLGRKGDVRAYVERDLDGDGLPDTWEREHFGDVAVDPNADADGDGVSNEEEYRAGTDPLDERPEGDWDRDGLTDDWELAHGLDPFDPADATADSDGDGLNNLQECQAGTDPLAADTDGDGLSDGWEVSHGLDPSPSGALQAWWAFEEDAFSPVAADGSANGYDAVWAEGRAMRPALGGPAGQAAAFDGSNDWLTVFGGSNLFERGAFSVSAAVTFEPDGDWQCIFTRGDDCVLGYTPYTRRLCFIVGQAQAEASVPTGEWFLATATWDGSEARLYVNGRLEDTVSATNAPRLPQELTIGDYVSHEYGYQWKGAMADLRIYGTVLTAEEAAADAECLGDLDGDGLANYEEARLGTDPRNADSDGDGTPDGAEVEDGTDPSDPGSLPVDMAGTVRYEGRCSGAGWVELQGETGCVARLCVTNGTFRFERVATRRFYTLLAWVDADANGECDPWEPQSELLGPFQLTNGVEDLGLEMADRDQDADGLLDWWERKHFQSLDSLAWQDPDADGYANLEEYEQGTDPCVHFVSDGQVIYYPLDGPGIEDRSGAGNAGAVVGALAFGPSIMGDSPFFDGTGKIQCTNAGLDALAWPGLTVAGWVWSGEGDGGMVAGRQGQWTLSKRGLAVGETGAWLAEVPTNWYWLAGVWDGTTVRTYVNGQLVSEVPGGSMPAATGPELSVGELLNGRVDELRIYGRALSADEVGRLAGDTEWDGLPDDWERGFFGGLDEGPEGDPDLDASSNGEEQTQGTDPTVTSPPQAFLQVSPEILSFNWWCDRTVKGHGGVGSVMISGHVSPWPQMGWLTIDMLDGEGGWVETVLSEQRQGGDFCCVWSPRQYVGGLYTFRAQWREDADGDVAEATRAVQIDSTIYHMQMTPDKVYGGVDSAPIEFRIDGGSTISATWELVKLADGGAEIVSEGARSMTLSPGSEAGCYLVRARNPLCDLCFCETEVNLLKGDLIPDWNHDRVITANDRIEMSTNTFHFWINDDDDSGNEASGDSDQPGHWSWGTSPADCSNDGVDGRCDLLDFFPVWLDLHDTLNVLPPGGTVQYRLKQANGAVRAVYTDLTKGSAGNFLTTEGNTYGPSFNQNSYEADAFEVTSFGVALSTDFLDKIEEDATKGVLMVEGKGATTAPLVLEVWKDGTKICEKEMPLKLSGVEDMYRWINLRPGGGPATSTSEPVNNPDALSNGKNVFFLHGFSVNADGARAWNAEIFKRLHQSGSRAKFWGMTWEGDLGLVNALHYQEDVANSLTVSSNFSAQVGPVPGTKIVLAHSLGNMVVSSAIQDHSLSVNKYFMLDAAVATECYDPSAFNEAVSSNYMLHSAWSGYSSKTWCAKWFELFSAPDDREKLRWKNRFPAVLSVAHNFYSSGDEIFEIHASPGRFSGGLFHLERHAWQKQELFKGCGGPGGTDWAGWGFAGHWEDDEWVYNYTSAEANAASETQLRANPVFLHTPATMLSSNIAAQVQNDIIAQGVPALSYAAGRNTIAGAVQNYNANDHKPNGWGRDDDTYHTRWLHSDLRNMAYFYTHGLFDGIALQGGLK